VQAPARFLEPSDVLFQVVVDPVDRGGAIRGAGGEQGGDLSRGMPASARARTFIKAIASPAP